MPVSLISSPRFADHLTPPGHPERASRAGVMQAVAAKWAALGVPVLAPRPATREELLRVHTPAHVDRITATSGVPAMLDGDTFTSPDTAEVAALAAGAALVALGAVLDLPAPPVAPNATQPRPEDAGTSRSSGREGAAPGPRASVALVRPPGHHAKPARAMGFCLYNNVAIAAAHALAGGVARVAVVDYDVHHGNGTQWAFYDDPRVLVISTHQWPCYPGSGAAGEVGEGRGEGFTLNVPLEPGATDGDYRVVFERLILPVLDAFGPDVLLVSAGFDAHMCDPIAQMAMSVAGYSTLARMLRGFAAGRRAPIVFVTEGGYHLRALHACLDHLVAVLGEAEDRTEVLSRVDGQPTEPLSPDDAPLVERGTADPTHRGPAAVDRVRSVQKPYWPTL